MQVGEADTKPRHVVFSEASSPGAAVLSSPLQHPHSGLHHRKVSFVSGLVHDESWMFQELPDQKASW